MTCVMLLLLMVSVFVKVVFKFSGATGMETVSTIECEHGLCESLCSAVVDVSMYRMEILCM